jgi:hypothetical protein
VQTRGFFYGRRTRAGCKHPVIARKIARRDIQLTSRDESHCIGRSCRGAHRPDIGHAVGCVGQPRSGGRHGSAGITSGDLGQLQYFLAREQSSERDFLNGRAGSAKAFYAFAAHFSTDLSSISTAGSSSDQQLASVAQVLHQRYVASFSSYLTALRARHLA